MAAFHNVRGENWHYSGESSVDPISSDQSVVVGDSDYTPLLAPKESHSHVCNFECTCNMLMHLGVHYLLRLAWPFVFRSNLPCRSTTQSEVTMLPSDFVNANDDKPYHLLAHPVELAQKSLGSTGEEIRTSSTSLASGSGLIAFLVDTVAQKYSQMRLFSLSG
jgi:hypothetical protein